MYLQHHCKDIYDSIMSGGRPRLQQIERAIDKLKQQPFITLNAIAQALNDDGVPTISGKARWNICLVWQFLRKLGRFGTVVKDRTNQIDAAIDRLNRQGFVTGARTFPFDRVVTA
jgi:hypothetical protein